MSIIEKINQTLTEAGLLTNYVQALFVIAVLVLLFARLRKLNDFFTQAATAFAVNNNLPIRPPRVLPLLAAILMVIVSASIIWVIYFLLIFVVSGLRFIVGLF